MNYTQFKNRCEKELYHSSKYWVKDYKKYQKFNELKIAPKNNEVNEEILYTVIEGYLINKLKNKDFRKTFFKNPIFYSKLKIVTGFLDYYAEKILIGKINKVERVLFYKNYVYFIMDYIYKTNSYELSISNFLSFYKLLPMLIGEPDEV